MLNHLKSAADTAVGLTALRFGTAALSGIWLVLAANFLGLRSFGDLSLLLAVGAVLSVLADGGFGLAVNQRVARTGALTAYQYRSVVRKRSVLAAVAALATSVAYWQTSTDPSLGATGWYAVSLVATADYSTFFALNRGRGATLEEHATDAGSRVAVVLLGSVALAMNPTVTTAVAVYGVVDLATAILMRRWNRHRVIADDGTKAPDLTIRRTLPMAFGGLLGTLYNKVDVWMLGILTTPAAVGAYSAAFRVYEVTLIPATVQAGLVLSLRARSPEPMTEGVRRALRVGCGLSVLISGAMLISADIIVGLLFPKGFHEAVWVLRLLALSSLPAAVVGVLAPVFSVDYLRIFNFMVGGALLVNVVLNIVAIPAFDSRGAAMATIVSSIILAGSMIFYVGRQQRHFELR